MTAGAPPDYHRYAHVADSTPSPSRADSHVSWQDSHDVLGALIRLVGLRGVVLAVMDLGAPWRVTNAAAASPVLHTVAQGSAKLAVEAAPPATLHAGDAALLPRGGTYELTDRRGGARAAPVPVPEPTPGGPRCSLRAGGKGQRTRVTCCAFAFETVSAAPLLNLLPPVVIVRSEASAGVGTYLGELVREARATTPGSDAIVARLAELCFIGMLREHLASQGADDPGLLAAVTHPQVGRALGLIHAHLEAPWTVASLAGEVGMSRAAFAQAFGLTTGVAPIRYIQLCRIAEAKRMLAHTRMNLADVGQQVGYTDAAGFARAFRRVVGLSPREYRRASAPGPRHVPSAR